MTHDCGCITSGTTLTRWCGSDHCTRTVPLEPEEFPRCVGTIHVWSSVFTFGDACACGRFSLCQGEDGRLRTVDAMPQGDAR